MTRQHWWRVAQYALAIAFIVFAARTLVRQWQDSSAAQLSIQLQPVWLALSSVLVIVTYLLLVQIWRRVLDRFGARVSIGVAARVWFVSNLGKYVPGKVWQLTAMAGMMNGGMMGSMAGCRVCMVGPLLIAAVLVVLAVLLLRNGGAEMGR